MSGAQERAQIRRATLESLEELEALDAEVIAELERTYHEGWVEVAALIAAYGNHEGRVSLLVLAGLLADLRGKLAVLGQARDVALVGGIRSAATMGAGALEASLGSSATMRVAEKAVEQSVRFRAADGLTLSKRLWRLDHGAATTLGRAVSTAVAIGDSAHQAADRLVKQGLPVPAEMRREIKGAGVGSLGQVARESIVTGEGSAYANAHRVMRTEINRAHGEAYMAGVADLDEPTAIKFKLSPRHRVRDICDLFASQNRYGLGPGVYPDRRRCPWPAHPNTWSYTEVVFMDEVSEVDREGKDDPISWLKSQSRSDQDAILGQQKADVLRQGLLEKGAIRTPWRVLKKRLEKQGILEVAP